MANTDAIRGVYIITTPIAGGRDALVAATEAALRGGARVVQYRDKSQDAAARREDARALRAATQRAAATFIVNDDIDLAAAVGADGVHLGRDDGAVREARRRLGAGALIGVSCYNDLTRADWALGEGADYLAFGSAYPSPTKPDAARAGPGLLAQARQRFQVPLVAIGGIDASNAGALAAAGVDALAVISAVYQAADPEAAASALARAWRAGRR